MIGAGQSGESVVRGVCGALEGLENKKKSRINT